MRGPAGWLGANLATALAYAAAASLAFAFGLPPAYVSPVYPSSGIAVAALLILGPRVLPGVWLGNVLSSAVLLGGGWPTPEAVAVTLAGGFAAVGETLVAGWVMRRFASAPHPFDRPRDVVVFLLGGSMLAGLAGGLLGTVPVWLAGFIGPGEFWRTAMIWCLGDSAGIRLFAPLILAWHHGGSRLERVGMGRAVLTIAAAILAVSAAEAGSGLPVDYLYLPVVVWAAFWAGPRGATLAATLVSVITVLTAVNGRGAFIGGTMIDVLLLLEGFIGVVTATALLVCAVLARQAAAEASLAEHARTLEQRVADRTAELVQNNRLLSEKQRRIDDELGTAHALQSAILPSSFAGIAAAEVAAVTRPANEMSGDFYDVFEVADGKCGIVVADVAGKGVAAAFFMAVTRTLVRGAALSGRTPAGRVAAVNDALCRENPLTMFVTLFYAELDEATGELICVNAGHCPPMLLGREGVVRAVGQTGGMVLGVMPGLVFKEEQVALGSGEALFLYTDGVTEAFDPSGQLYGEERLLRTLSAEAGRGAEAVVRGVVQSVEAFAAGAEQADDITCLAVRRVAPVTPSAGCR